MVTCDHSIYVQTEEGEMKKYSPHMKPHLLYDEVQAVSGIPMKFLTDSGEVMFEEDRYYIKSCGFTIEPFLRPGMQCNLDDCVSYSLCNKSMVEQKCILLKELTKKGCRPASFFCSYGR